MVFKRFWFTSRKTLLRYLSDIIFCRLKFWCHLSWPRVLHHCMYTRWTVRCETPRSFDLSVFLWLWARPNTIAQFYNSVIYLSLFTFKNIHLKQKLITKRYYLHYNYIHHCTGNWAPNSTVAPSLSG